MSPQRSVLERKQERWQFSESELGGRSQQTLSLLSGNSDRPQGPWHFFTEGHPRTFHGNTVGPFVESLILITLLYPSSELETHVLCTVWPERNPPAELI